MIGHAFKAFDAEKQDVSDQQAEQHAGAWLKRRMHAAKKREVEMRRMIR